VKTIDEVTDEIAAIKETIRKLEADKDRHVLDLVAAKSSREADALAALAGDDDVDAQKRLTDARTVCRDSELLIEDTTSAIHAAQQKLQLLEVEREEAVRADAWTRFLATAEKAIAEAEQIEKAVDELAVTMAKHEKTLRSLTALSFKAGRSKLFRLSHARRAMEHKLSRSLPKEFSHYKEFAGGYLEFLRDRVANVGNTNGAVEAEPDQEIAQG